MSSGFSHFRCFSDEQMSKKAVEHQPNNVHNVIWVFPKIGVPQNGGFVMEKPIKMDDLGVPRFSETPIWLFLCMFFIEILFGRNCQAMDPMGQNAKKNDRLAWKDSCHGAGNPSGVGISKDQEPHATQLQVGSVYCSKAFPRGWGYMDG